jgi:hypothetical protein
MYKTVHRMQSENRKDTNIVSWKFGFDSCLPMTEKMAPTIDILENRLFLAWETLMIRHAPSPNFPGFGHSRNHNTRFSHASDRGIIEPGIPGSYACLTLARSNELLRLVFWFRE